MRAVISVLGFVLALLPLQGIGEAEPNWTLAKEADGIRVYTRSVPGSDFDAFRGETVLPAGREAVRTLVADIDRWPEWMHRNSEAVLLKHDGALERFTYSVNSFPWPASDRIFLVRSKEVADPQAQTVRITLQGVDKAELSEEARERLPDYGKRVPVESVSGFWRFRVLGPERTEAVYELHTEVGGRLPSGLVNRLIVDTPFETLRALRQLLQREAED